MNDLISRQAAILHFVKTSKNYECRMLDLKEITHELWQIPSAQPEQLERCPIYDGVCGYPSDQCYDCPRHHGAQPEQRWIPCSERLPEQYGNYLISIDGKDSDIGTINPNDPRGWSLCDANGFYWANDKALNITAWQTLPEPYREEGEADD